MVCRTQSKLLLIELLAELEGNRILLKGVTVKSQWHRMGTEWTQTFRARSSHCWGEADGNHFHSGFPVISWQIIICRTSPRSTFWLLKAVLKIFTMSGIFCVSAGLYSETSLWIISQILLFVVGMQVISPMPSLSSCSVRRSYISFIASIWTTTEWFLCLLSLLCCVARGCWCSSNSHSIISVRNSCADLVLIVIFQKMPLLHKWTNFAPLK